MTFSNDIQSTIRSTGDIAFGIRGEHRRSHFCLLVELNHTSCDRLITCSFVTTRPRSSTMKPVPRPVSDHTVTTAFLSLLNWAANSSTTWTSRAHDCVVVAQIERTPCRRDLDRLSPAERLSLEGDRIRRRHFVLARSKLDLGDTVEVCPCFDWKPFGRSNRERKAWYRLLIQRRVDEDRADFQSGGLRFRRGPRQKGQNETEEK